LSAENLTLASYRANLRKTDLAADKMKGGAVMAWLVKRVLRVVYRQVCQGRPALAGALASNDVEFVFPGGNSFAGAYRGKAELLTWLRRFGSLHPRFTIHEVTVGGWPWDLRVAMRFTDAIGDDYRNEGVELIGMRWGRVRRIQVFLDTERISAWEQRHPEVTTGATLHGASMR